jgi:hypothetical protein
MGVLGTVLISVCDSVIGNNEETTSLKTLNVRIHDAKIRQATE